MNSAIDPRSILKTTHRTFDELRLESGFSSFIEGLQYKFHEVQQTMGVLGFLAFVGLFAATIAPILRDMFAENPVDGRLVLGAVLLSILVAIIGCIVGYAYAQIWLFERSTNTLLWTQKFLLGSRTKRYRLERFVNVAVLDPRKEISGQGVLVLVRRGWYLFSLGKQLRLISIGSRNTLYLQTRLAIHQHLAQEIAEFMQWPAD